MLATAIKGNIDLVSVVETEGINLRRFGSRHVGPCPFHPDDTPSFFVFPDNHYHCFGCGAHGNAIDFVRKLHGYSFMDAMNKLGIDQGPSTSQQRGNIEDIGNKRRYLALFRAWEREAIDHVSTLVRCSRRLLGNIQTEHALHKFGHLYHGIPTWEHHLDVLMGDDDEAKLELYCAGYYG